MTKYDFIFINIMKHEAKSFDELFKMFNLTFAITCICENTICNNY